MGIFTIIYNYEDESFFSGSESSIFNKWNKIIIVFGKMNDLKEKKKKKNWITMLKLSSKTRKSGKYVGKSSAKLKDWQIKP